MPSSTAPLPTPPKCIADFCLIPLGTATASISPLIADVQRLLIREAEGQGPGRDKEELKFSMHSAGTTVEGSWDAVMRVIGQAHSLVHGQGVLRVQTDIRVGTRTDKSQSIEDKVRVVETLLAEDRKQGLGMAGDKEGGGDEKAKGA